ncbi:hypothetical protein NE92_22775 [Salmonella enterica]|nr:hypothetical protein [Salmonella enterica]
MKSTIRKAVEAIGSILNITPETDYSLPARRYSDAQQIAGDWYRVGNDCRSAMKRYAAGHPTGK